MIFALDTSTEQASVAFVGDAGPRAECSWAAGGNHSRHLDRVLSLLLDIQNISLADVTAIAVAVGPGSFSGTRVGISAAKGYAVALNVPVAGISTLDILGFQAMDLTGPILASIPAGRGQLYVAGYPGNGRMQPASEITVAGIADVAAAVPDETVLIGPGAPLIQEALQDRATHLRLASSPSQLRRAAYLAELGKRYFAAGGADQRDTLEPLYLRKSAAEEQRGR